MGAGPTQHSVFRRVRSRAVRTPIVRRWTAIEHRRPKVDGAQAPRTPAYRTRGETSSGKSRMERVFHLYWRRGEGRMMLHRAIFLICELAKLSGFSYTSQFGHSRPSREFHPLEGHQPWPCIIHAASAGLRESDLLVFGPGCGRGAGARSSMRSAGWVGSSTWLTTETPLRRRE